MITEKVKDVAMFKLVGLQRNPEGDVAATCELKDKEETFIANIGMSKKQKESLWEYCNTDWSNKKVAKVEFDEMSSTGKPVNPIVTAIWNG